MEQSIKGNEQYISIVDLAKHYGIDSRTIYAKIRSGVLHSKVINEKKHARLEDCDVLFESEVPKSGAEMKHVKMVDGTKVDINMSAGEAERLDKIWKARRQEIACKKAEGELIELVDARKRIFHLSRKTRDSLRHIPGSADAFCESIRYLSAHCETVRIFSGRNPSTQISMSATSALVRTFVSAV